MIFLVTWKGRPEQRDRAIQRFMQTGGRPPEGVRMIGRWHALGRISGMAVAECDDPGLLQKWALEWNDLFEMDICPALPDEQMGPLMAVHRPH